MRQASNAKRVDEDDDEVLHNIRRFRASGAFNNSTRFHLNLCVNRFPIHRPFYAGTRDGAAELRRNADAAEERAFRSDEAKPDRTK